MGPKIQCVFLVVVCRNRADKVVGSVGVKVLIPSVSGISSFISGDTNIKEIVANYVFKSVIY